MNPIFSKLIAKATGISERQVQGTVGLLEEGCTIPFISRYRKEVTGTLDEVQVANISDQLEKLKELEKRKETILKTIEEQGKLTPELQTRIEGSWDSTELEDIYLPYKPKRKTRAEVARQKGLEPLATFLMLQNPNADIDKKVKEFINEEKGVKTAEEAIQGAQDIIAEQVSESEAARNIVRFNFKKDAVITSKLKKTADTSSEKTGDTTEADAASKYRDYFDFSEKLSKCASHRLLAMRRGEAEGFLRVSISGSASAATTNVASTDSTSSSCATPAEVPNSCGMPSRMVTSVCSNPASRRNSPIYRKNSPTRKPSAFS